MTYEEFLKIKNGNVVQEDKQTEEDKPEIPSISTLSEQEILAELKAIENKAKSYIDNYSQWKLEQNKELVECSNLSFLKEETITLQEGSYEMEVYNHMVSNNKELLEAYGSSMPVKLSLFIANALKKAAIPTLTTLATGATVGFGGAGGAAAVMSGVIGYVIQNWATKIVKAKGGWRMIWARMTNQKTQQMIYTHFLAGLNSIQSNISLNLQVVVRDKKTIDVICLYHKPSHRPPVIRITIDEGGCSVVPIEYGGFKIVASISAERLSGIDMGKFGFVGSDYKIPARSLNYQSDIMKLWYLILDYISEIYNELITYLRETIHAYQSAKTIYAQHFASLAERYDLNSEFIKEVNYAQTAVTAEAERLLQQRRNASRRGGRAFVDAIDTDNPSTAQIIN